LKSFFDFLTNKIDASTNDEESTINSFVKNSSKYFLNSLNSIIDKLYIDSNENILFFVFIAWFCESCLSNLLILILSKTFAKFLYFSRIFFNDFIIISMMSSYIKNLIFNISLHYNTKAWTFFRLQYFSKINWLIIIISTFCRFFAIFFASFLLKNVFSKFLNFELLSTIIAWILFRIFFTLSIRHRIMFENQSMFEFNFFNLEKFKIISIFVMFATIIICFVRISCSFASIILIRKKCSS
jgi:hypothetical protein